MATGTDRIIVAVPDIAVATGGRILFRAQGRAGVTSVVVDTRMALEGCLFVALPGERTDGHEFLSQAAAAGAAALLVSDAQAARRTQELAGIAADRGVGRWRHLAGAASELVLPVPMMNLINGETIQSKRLTAELIVRKSSAAPKAA